MSTFRLLNQKMLISSPYKQTRFRVVLPATSTGVYHDACGREYPASAKSGPHQTARTPQPCFTQAIRKQLLPATPSSQNRNSVFIRCCKRPKPRQPAESSSDWLNHGYAHLDEAGPIRQRIAAAKAPVCDLRLFWPASLSPTYKPPKALVFREFLWQTLKHAAVFETLYIKVLLQRVF